MTVKEFAKKYGTNAIRVKAALNLSKSRKNGGIGSRDENNMVFTEEQILESWYVYLMEDMRACVDRASQDNQLLRDAVKISADSGL